MIDLDGLSIWEIGFRMEDKDPDHFNENNIPVEVKDNFRSISAAIIHEFLTLYLGENCHLTVRRGKEHDELAHKYKGKLFTIIEGRSYPSELLKEVTIERDEFFWWLCEKGTPIPEFWDCTEFFSTWTRDDSSPAPIDEHSNDSSLGENTPKHRHTNTIIDKELCRAIASTLWLEDPELKIAEICRHEAIQRFGNGAQYKGRDTIRNWIGDLDPKKKELS